MARTIEERQDAPGRSSDRSRWVAGAVGGVAGLVLAALLIVFVLDDDSGDSSDVPVETAVGEIIGDPLPPVPADGVDDPAIGAPAPELASLDATGEWRRITLGDGDARLLVFLSHWCASCEEDAAILAGLRAESVFPVGVELEVVSSGGDDRQRNWPPSSFLATAGLPPTYLVDTREGELVSSFGGDVTELPLVVAIAGDATVVDRAVGPLDRDTLLDLVDRLR